MAGQPPWRGAPPERAAIAADQDAGPSSSGSDLGVTEDLEDCSPFYNMDGSADLNFDADEGKVTETVGGAARTSGASSKAPTMEVAGNFRAIGQNRVLIVLGGVKDQYTLVVPPEGDQCILAKGEATAVDLSRSWFGTEAEDPGPPGPDAAATTSA